MKWFRHILPCRVRYSSTDLQVTALRFRVLCFLCFFFFFFNGEVSLLILDQQCDMHVSVYVSMCVYVHMCVYLYVCEYTYNMYIVFGHTYCMSKCGGVMGKWSA